MHLLLRLALTSVGLTLLSAAPSAEVLGPSVAPNPGFEAVSEEGKPLDWLSSDQPQGCAKVSLDDRRALTGKRALRLELPGSGGVSLRSSPFPVEPGKQYLFSVGFRSEGFGPKGKYSGVSSAMAVEWQDDAGKSAGRSLGVGFPYHASDWDLRDAFVQAPANAARAVITCGFSNNSRETTGEDIPSTLWLDGVQFRSYTPPASPEWAMREAAPIVEGGWESSPVKVYHLAGLAQAGGKWGEIVSDPQSVYGTVVASPEGVGKGIMAHSPYFRNPRPGLYRAVLRCKVADTRREELAGFMDIASGRASARALLNLYPADFAAADTYQEFSVDFILRAPGYWLFRVYTEGNQTFTADTVKVFPVELLDDRQLLDIYPGSDGTVPEGIRPQKGGPFTGLLVAGPMYDYWRVVDAFHIAGYSAKLTTVWSQTQTFPGFPETPEELFGFNVIYLCDVDAGFLTVRQKRMLVEYVRRGGGLVLLGGHRAFDRGRMAGSLLDEERPVASQQKTFLPLARFPTGVPLRKGSEHPVVAFTDLSEQPLCFCMHEVQARDGADVILMADDRPAIVLGKAGMGRIACAAMTCFGDPGEGQTPFWKWPGWVVLLRDISWWAAGEDQHF